jgi:hypothetical protein
MMISKSAPVFFAYSVVSFVVLPPLVIGGTLALFLYAVLAELGECLIDSGHARLDPFSAREVAHRMCLHNDAKIRG